jgi:hypothetical protein
MSACRRFEEEGLLRLERGEELDEHFSTCAECRQAWQAYRALGAELRSLGGEEQPPAGWQAEVWRQIEERRGSPVPKPGTVPSGPWKRWLGPAMLAAAAVLALVVLIPRWTQPVVTLSLTASVQKGGETRRGAEEAQPGDRLILEARGPRRARLEIRLYRGEREWVARCPGGEGCTVRPGRLRWEIPLAAVGTYQTALLESEGDLPAPGAGLDADCGAALRAGARLQLGPEITVR